MHNHSFIFVKFVHHNHPFRQRKCRHTSAKREEVLWLCICLIPLCHPPGTVYLSYSPLPPTRYCVFVLLPSATHLVLHSSYSPLPPTWYCIRLTPLCHPPGTVYLSYSPLPPTWYCVFVLLPSATHLVLYSSYSPLPRTWYCVFVLLPSATHRAAVKGH